MQKKTKKDGIIAPIIIIAFLLFYLLFYFFCLMLMPNIPLVVRVLIGIIPLVIMGFCIYVLIERILELRSNEYDDLSQY